MTETDSKTSEASTEEVAQVESQPPPSPEAPSSDDSELLVSDQDSERESVPLTEAEAESGTETVSETDTVFAAEIAATSDTATDLEAGPDTVAASLPLTEAEAESVAESESETEGRSESEPSVGAAIATPSGGEPDAETEAPVETVSAEADTVAGGAAPEDSADEKGKKKRRRRRKKKGGQAGLSDVPPDSKSPHHHAPFLHLFTGGPSRKHAFSVGEIIAGRVERVEHGTIVADLFGKASAIADVDEPREIPIVTHGPEEPESIAAQVEPSEPEAPEGSEAPEPETPAEAGAPAKEPSVWSPAPGPTARAVMTPPDHDDDDDLAFEYSPTAMTQLPAVDDDLGEADTVVGAEAFDPTRLAETGDEPAPRDEAAIENEAVIESETAIGKEAGAPIERMPSDELEIDISIVSQPPQDLADADLTLLDPLPELDPPQIGAIFRGRIGAVAESGHIAIVNRIVDKAAVREALRAARELHQRVQGVVYGYNRGGFDVLVGGVRAFCPASGMSLTPIEDPNAFVGVRCEFALPQDKGGKKGSIIVSRRNILEKEARRRARERMEQLEIGTHLKGTVTEVRDYGVLVDLGDGLDGLVHMSEVSWNRGAKPRDVATVGEEVDVQVLKVQPATRKDRYGRVALSMRACQPDPWDAVEEAIRPGMPIKGKVVRTTEFGAFVELQESIEGLLHISELGGAKELSHAKQAVDEGEEIDVVVERVDREQRRISLSKLSEADAKAIEAGEIEFGKAPRSLKPGTHVTVVVKRVEHSGAQVQVEGMLGKRGRGFIPNRELQDVRGEKRKGPSQGDVLEVKVIGTERDGTLRCSIRGRLLDEERRAVREYRKESAKQGLGTFGDLLKAKLGGGDSGD